MRHLLAAIVFATSALALTACETLDSPAQVGRNTVVETAGSLVRRYASTWNARDMAGFGALYAADARHVNTSGTFLRGRNAIVAAHRDNRSRYAQAARMTTQLRGARAITDDAIVAVMAMQIRDTPEAAPAYASRLTLTLVRRDGAWVIAQAQASAPPPNAPTPVAAKKK